MKKIILLALVCTGFVVTTPFTAQALKSARASIWSQICRWLSTIAPKIATTNIETTSIVITKIATTSTIAIKIAILQGRGFANASFQFITATVTILLPFGTLREQRGCANGSGLVRGTKTIVAMPNVLPTGWSDVGI